MREKVMSEPDANLLGPKDQGEAVALFRAQMIGTLAHRHFDSHGQLERELREISRVRVMPPGTDGARSYWMPSSRARARRR